MQTRSWTNLIKLAAQLWTSMSKEFYVGKDNSSGRFEGIRFLISVIANSLVIVIYNDVFICALNFRPLI